MQRQDVRIISWVIIEKAKWLTPFLLGTDRWGVCFNTASDTSSSQIFPQSTKGRRDFKLHWHLGMPRSLLNWNGFHWQAEEGRRFTQMAWQCQNLAILLFWNGSYSKSPHVTNHDSGISEARDRGKVTWPNWVWPVTWPATWSGA